MTIRTRLKNLLINFWRVMWTEAAPWERQLGLAILIMANGIGYSIFTGIITL